MVKIGRQLISNQYLYPYWKRTFPIMRYENEISTVCPGDGIRHKTPGQRGKGAGSYNRGKDEATQYQQYLRYLYPNIGGEILSREGKKQSNFEDRLDVLAYHLDFSSTKRSSRQDVSHKHFSVNGHRVNAPSYRLKIGDVVECGKRLPHRFGFSKPYYSSCEVNHRIRAAILLNPKLPCETSVCNVRRVKTIPKFSSNYNFRSKFKYNSHFRSGNLR